MLQSSLGRPVDTVRPTATVWAALKYNILGFNKPVMGNEGNITIIKKICNNKRHSTGTTPKPKKKNKAIAKQLSRISLAHIITENSI